MPLSISFFHSKRGDGNSYQSVVLHDRAKVQSKMALSCEFYRNIWGLSDEEDAARRRRNRTTKLGGSPASRRFKQRVTTGPLIDIAQVAHVVTTGSDFRADYGEDASRARLVNLWDDRSLALGLEPELQSSRDLQTEPENGPSTADTEPEDLMSPIHSRAARISEVSDEDSDSERGPVGLLQRTNTPLIVLPSPKKPANRASRPQHKCNTPGTGSPVTAANGSVVFSAVLSEPRDWSWSAKFLLGVHEPIRHALFVTDRFLQQSLEPQANPPQKGRSVDTIALEAHVAEFFAWFKSFFVEYLRCQHEVKAAVLLPLLQLPAATKSQILDVYKDIYQLLAQIQQLERALCVSGACSASSWLLRLDVLRSEIRQLNSTLHATLDLEETALHPALTAAFTERAFYAHVMPRVFRAIRAKRVVVPWIVERSKIWGGEAEQRSIQGLLPFSARFLYRKIWRPYFMSNVAVAMTNLNEFGDFDSRGDSSSSGSNASSLGERQSEMCSIM
ncbi:hypothetical protein BBJ28_00009502 [Nothophytophthora sp. Chile5]|nr:hypothetical protein BBJ28_00009502 [Nothophytophthora sp. Chile5]